MRLEIGSCKACCLPVDSGNAFQDPSGTADIDSARSGRLGGSRRRTLEAGRIFCSLKSISPIASQLRGDPGRKMEFSPTRRKVLRDATIGIGLCAPGTLLSPSFLWSTGYDPANPLTPKTPLWQAKAKPVIHIFINCSLMQVDTFDLMPTPANHVGKPLPIHLRTDRPAGAAFPSPFEFRKYGQSGAEVSEVFAGVADLVDDLCVIRSMHMDSRNVRPSLLMMNTGTTKQSPPSVGSWLTYGLRGENRAPPGRVVLCPSGWPAWGAKNGRAAFLPCAFQETHSDTSLAESDNLDTGSQSKFTSRKAQRRPSDLLGRLSEPCAVGGPVANCSQSRCSRWSWRSVSRREPRPCSTSTMGRKRSDTSTATRCTGVKC